MNGRLLWTARLGGWEVDTVLGKHGTGALVTPAERKSWMYLVRKVEAKRAANVQDAIIDMLKKRLSVKPISLAGIASLYHTAR